MTELAVTIGQIQLHRRACLGPAAPDLRKFELEAIRTVDANAVLGLRHGIEDGLTARFDMTGYYEAGTPALDVDLEFDIREDRFVNLVQRAGKDIEEGRAGLRVLARQDAQQGSALGFVGA